MGKQYKLEQGREGFGDPKRHQNRRDAPLDHRTRARRPTHGGDVDGMVDPGREKRGEQRNMPMGADEDGGRPTDPATTTANPDDGSTCVEATGDDGRRWARGDDGRWAPDGARGGRRVRGARRTTKTGRRRALCCPRDETTGTEARAPA